MALNSTFIQAFQLENKCTVFVITTSLTHLLQCNVTKDAQDAQRQVVSICSFFCLFTLTVCTDGLLSEFMQAKEADEYYLSIKVRKWEGFLATRNICIHMDQDIPAGIYVKQFSCLGD